MPLDDFIAQVVEHSTAITDFMGLNPIFSQVIKLTIDIKWCSCRHSYFIFTAIGHVCIVGIGLKLACNGGSCRGISLKINIIMSFALEKMPTLASAASPSPIQKWSIYYINH